MKKLFFILFTLCVWGGVFAQVDSILMKNLMHEFNNFAVTQKEINLKLTNIGELYKTADVLEYTGYGIAIASTLGTIAIIQNPSEDEYLPCVEGGYITAGMCFIASYIYNKIARHRLANLTTINIPAKKESIYDRHEAVYNQRYYLGF